MVASSLQAMQYIASRLEFDVPQHGVPVASNDECEVFVPDWQEPVPALHIYSRRFGARRFALSEL